jgi:hypothetical protein
VRVLTGQPPLSPVNAAQLAMVTDVEADPGRRPR